MIYLEPNVRFTSHTLYNNAAQGGKHCPDISPEKSDNEFFKTKLTRDNLIYFTSSFKMRPNTRIVIGHVNPDADSIVSAIAYAHLQQKLVKKFENETGIKSNRTIIAASTAKPDSQTQAILDRFGVNAPMVIEDVDSVNKNNARHPIIMVDHNELSQSVKGTKVTDVSEIVDHHRLDFEGVNPISVHTEPVGATATVVADLYEKNDITIPTKIAGILLGAILSDTFSLTSNTTHKDITMATKLAKIANIDKERFGEMILNAAAVDYYEKPMDEVINSELKTYRMGPKTIGVSQVIVTSPQDFLETKKDETLQYLATQEKTQELKPKQKYDHMILMVTDVKGKVSYLLFTDKSSKLIDQAFQTKSRNNQLYLPGAQSRKTHVIPNLTKVFQSSNVA